jgi:hypothetical protein
LRAASVFIYTNGNVSEIFKIVLLKLSREVFVQLGRRQGGGGGLQPPIICKLAIICKV